MGNRSWSRSRSQSRSRESPESEPKSRRQFLCRFWKFMSFAWKVFYCVYNSKCVWIAGVCVCECRMGNEWAALFVCALCRLLPAPLSVNVAHKLFNTLPLVAIKKNLLIGGKCCCPTLSDMRHCICICYCLHLYLLCTLGSPPHSHHSSSLVVVRCSTCPFGGTASFVCVTLLDSWIACLVFEQFMCLPDCRLLLAREWRKCGKLV